MQTQSIKFLWRTNLAAHLLRLALVLPLVACGSGSADADRSDSSSPSPSSAPPENPAEPHTKPVFAWGHEDAVAERVGPVENQAVRASTHYRASVAPASEPEASMDSFVYMSIPRSGRGKIIGPDRGTYTHEDGAEFASEAQLTMSWTSFLYSEDAWLELEWQGEDALTSLDQVTIRPTTLDLEMELAEENRLRIKVPYHEAGHRFSVELDQDLMTSFNNLQGGTGQLTEGPDGARIHTEPRNAMLVFAEPALTQEQRDSLIPDDRHGSIYYPETGEVNLDSITEEIVYFKPGTYHFPWNYHATLPQQVRWVYLAPGAYVKGALEFQGEQQDYKVTGHGVLSGENYVYEADTDNSDGHEPYTTRAASQSDCHGSCVKMLQFFSQETAQTLTIHGVTIKEPPYHSFVIYGDNTSFETQVSHYKQVGAWFWQTDGIELFGNGQLTQSFFHANDDVFKLYHSHQTIDDILVWKSENGPVFQWGWTPRDIENIAVSNIDIIHNRMYWKDQKHNTCLINSAKAWWDTHANNTADLETTIENVHLKNIRSEGMNLCAMRLYAQSNWSDIHIDGLEIEAWNDLSVDSQESQFQALWNEDESAQVSVGEGNSGLLLENYVVDRQPITREADNWSSEKVGRLNFSVDLWDSWDAISDKSIGCTAQEVTIDEVGDLAPGDTVPVSASASSGLPLHFYDLNGNASISTDGMLTAGEEPGTVLLVAAQDGDETWCRARAFESFHILSDGETPAPGQRWVGASWEDWSPGNLPMEWDGEAEFVVSTDLSVGDYALKFTDTEDWSGDDWADSQGLTGTASLTTGGGPDITFSIETAGTYEIRFNPESLDYAITLQ